MILSDVDIQAALASGEIIITPFSTKLEPASYDLRVGDKAVTKTVVHTDVAKELHLVIPRGEMAVVYPMERIQIGRNHCARIGLTSRLARQGLLLLSGPQIDPGFRGYLAVTVFNLGWRDIILVHSEPFTTIEFERLSSTASHDYSGQFQNQELMTADIINYVRTSRKGFADFEREVGDIKREFKIINLIVSLFVFGSAAGVVGAAAKYYLFDKLHSSDSAIRTDQDQAKPLPLSPSRQGSLSDPVQEGSQPAEGPEH